MYLAAWIMSLYSLYQEFMQLDQEYMCMDQDIMLCVTSSPLDLLIIGKNGDTDQEFMPYLIDLLLTGKNGNMDQEIIQLDKKFMQLDEEFMQHGLGCHAVCDIVTT